MLTILGWVIVGYLAGSAALWLVPPKQPVPGWEIIAYGVAGSIVGGMVSSSVSGGPYSPAGLFWSVAGAAVVVAGWRWYQESP